MELSNVKTTMEFLNKFGSKAKGIIEFIDKFDDKAVEGMKAVRDILNVLIDIFDE